MPAARGATTTTTTSRCRDINHARPLSIGRLCGGATGARGKTLHNVGDFRHWPPAEIKASDLFENQCNQLVGELPFEFMASKQIDGRAGRATHTHLMLLFVVVCCCSLLLLLLVWKNCRNAPAQPNETGRRPAIHLASNRKRAAQQANWWLYDHLPFRPNDIKRRPNDIRPRAWHWAAGNTVAAILLSVCPFVWRSCCRRILLLRVRGRALQMGDPYIMRQEWRQVEWGGRPAGGNNNNRRGRAAQMVAARGSADPLANALARSELPNGKCCRCLVLARTGANNGRPMFAFAN